MPTIAVVIPTLDEERTIRRHLPPVLAAADEVVVSDGGSGDGTTRLAAALGARVVSGPPGRGPQLNRGAFHTTADVLLFLHSDTRLPEGGLAAVRRAIDSGGVGGGFRTRFDDRRLYFRVGSALINLRTLLTRAPLGDQAQFVTRTAFQQLDGFRDWPILEDLDFILRLRRLGPIEIVPLQVVTSARRYVANGVVRTLANNWTIWLLYLLGASPHRLARRYRRIP